MQEVLYLAFAGALGALSRYGLSGFTQRIMGAGFPYGTLIVNVLGCLIIGFVMQVGLTTDVIPRTLRVVITIGFLGAFTTFSSFSWETLRLMEDGAWLAASTNILANVILCLLAVYIGSAIGKVTFGGA